MPVGSSRTAGRDLDALAPLRCCAAMITSPAPFSSLPRSPGVRCTPRSLRRSRPLQPAPPEPLPLAPRFPPSRPCFHHGRVARDEPEPAPPLPAVAPELEPPVAPPAAAPALVLPLLLGRRCRRRRSSTLEPMSHAGRTSRRGWPAH